MSRKIKLDSAKGQAKINQIDMHNMIHKNVLKVET